MADRDIAYTPTNESITPEEQSYGAVPESTTRNTVSEEREAKQSEVTGRIPRREVGELRAEAGNLGNVRGGTRYQGKSNDAYKQERQLDQSLSDEGAV